MAEFNFDTVSKVAGTSGRKTYEPTEFFKLESNTTAKVFFLYREIREIEGFTTHKVAINSSFPNRHVDCLGKGVCPFCNANLKASGRLFVYLYDCRDNKVKVWDRPISFYQDLTRYLSHAPQGTPLYALEFEVSRIGKGLDTRYDLFSTCQPNPNFTPDLQKVKSVKGGLVMTKTASDIQYFLANGEFPEVQNTQQAQHTNIATQNVVPRQSYSQQNVGQVMQQQEVPPTQYEQRPRMEFNDSPVDGDIEF